LSPNRGRRLIAGMRLPAENKVAVFALWLLAFVFAGHLGSEHGNGSASAALLALKPRVAD
jgi:hypothetical protein